MAIQTRQKFKLDAFLAFVELPGNREGIFEFIDGEIIAVPSNPYVSVIASRIITFISMFLLQKKVVGHVTGEGGGFFIDGHVFAPDAAYMLHLPTHEGFEQVPPKLAVEVLSDPHSNTEQTDLRRKLVHYRRANVVVWVIDYVAQQVEVHVPDAAVEVLDVTGALKGGVVLPGFALPVKDIFPQEQA